MIFDVTGSLYKKILAGTIPAGDSKKLGGKEAGEYALSDELSKHTIPSYTVTTSEEFHQLLTELHENAEDNSVYEVEINVRHSEPALGVGGTFSLHGFRDDSLYGWQRFGYYSHGMLRQRSLKNGVWSEIKTFATTADLATALANYLSLGGGMLESSTREMLKMNNTAGNGGGIGVYNNGTKIGEIKVSVNGLSFTDANDTTYPVLHSGNIGSYALPKTGGKLTGDLILEKCANGYSMLYKNHTNDNDYGTDMIDIDANGNSVVLRVSAKDSKAYFKWNELLHTGNSQKVTITNSASEAPTEMSGLWAY